MSSSRRSMTAFGVALLMLFWLQVSVVSSFSFPHSSAYAKAASFPSVGASFSTPISITHRQGSFELSARDEDYDTIDGSDKGNYLLAVSFLLCVWGFSIPPEIRREHICATDRCTENRSLPSCHNCVTTREWLEEVATYYRNGGGVHFDFTVAEETKELFKK